MSYSASDFADDILNRLTQIGVLDSSLITPDDPQSQAEAALQAIQTLTGWAGELAGLLRQAAAPGGIGQHEFSRPGGWRERALATLAMLEQQAPLPVFYVRADAPNGQPLDLLVRAADPAEATESWRCHFSALKPLQAPDWVGKIPLFGPRGPISWCAIRPDADLHPENANGSRA